MSSRETHPIVRFYVHRELIDLEDESMNALLDGPIPANSSPRRRKLWIYGNFERGDITSDQALKYLAKLLDDPRRQSEWLWHHLFGAK